MHGARKYDDTRFFLIAIAFISAFNYYLTYHKWATADQLLAYYPQFPEFLCAKKRYDPDEIFVSNWYNSLNPMFS